MLQVAEIQEKDYPDTLTSKANLAVTSTDLINLFDSRKIFVVLKEVFTQYGFWNIWLLAGVYGRISAMIGREYLF
jgi:hypothetical protein